jgi:predicted metal-dependent hydrolase
MSHKSARIAAMVESCQGKELNAHYLAYFECFNRELFFEAHEVLEALWLPERKGPKDLFYKGLIQLAGAFVHVQKQRWQPAAALLLLADGNLARYPESYEHLDLTTVRRLINQWLEQLGDKGQHRPMTVQCFPKLSLR